MRAVARRPDWRFEQVSELRIPAPDGWADFVCFYSVLTHLAHEHAFIYLTDAVRVLKPGGRIVLSFLEFASPAHWNVFAATVANARAKRDATLNVFLGRDALAAWAAHLGLAVVNVRDGSDRFVPLPEPLTLDGGEVMRGFGCLGQSVCVLAKP